MRALLILWLGIAWAQPPSDSEVRKILAEHSSGQGQGWGIVAGIIEPKGRRIVSTGNLDGDTIFEIGSATKVFTSLLLADMAERGEVALDDPIAKYLPAEVKVPERGGRSITLLDLSTHTSGLPRMPSNLSPKDMNNPYTDYSAQKLYQFLSGFELTRDIGSKFEYSNLGAGLLGHLLARRAGSEYEALVRSRICAPLAMNSTQVTLSPELKAKLTPGHNAQGAVVPNWDFQALAGCGALRSSVNDLLTFLAANLGFSHSPLERAMAAMVKPRRPTGQAGMEIALGWLVAARDGHEIIWHNGGTGGYRSFIGYDRQARVGVAVLSNSFTLAGVDPIGMRLLELMRR